MRHPSRLLHGTNLQQMEQSTGNEFNEHDGEYDINAEEIALKMRVTRFYRDCLADGRVTRNGTIIIRSEGVIKFIRDDLM